MSAVLSTIAASATSASIAWQIRYEQRAYWRNRGRGIFTFVFPLMFLVIFASSTRARTSRAAAGSPTTTSSCPGSSPTA